jgi:16S rRNA A1518/A1519 N6-dimethyltransferase RsmA/KsgA/DIM1 with predicted DNA glycosylase/AP lyase activity
MGVLLENRNNSEYEREPSPFGLGVRYPAIFYPLVRSLFASRRKTIKNNLTGFVASRLGKTLPAGTSAQDVSIALLTENGLSGRERAEELTPEVFLLLAQSVENMRL